MTLSASQTPDDKPETPGTAMTPAASGGIDPFIASLEAPPAAARPWHARILDYSAHAAMIVGLIGFAWTVSDHVVPRETAAQIDHPASTTVAAVTGTPAASTARASSVANPGTGPKPIDDLADLRRANQKMASEIKSLHASLETVRENLAKNRADDAIQALSARVDDVKAGLTSERGETKSAIADLYGKVEALRQPTSRMQQMVDRLGKLEHQADMAPTSSIPPETRTIPKPPVKPAALAGSDQPPATKETPAKPQVLAGWVVRDVYDGVAIIEGRRGPMEVVPGVSIPGAGVVKSIERHGAGWTVTTSKGLLAYAAPQRDYRRVQSRDYYQPYRYDF